MSKLASRFTQRTSHTAAAVVLALGLCALAPVAHAQTRDPVVGGVIGAGAGALIGGAFGGRDAAVIGAVIGGVAGANMGVEMRPARPVYNAYASYPTYAAYPTYPRYGVREVVYVQPTPYWREPVYRGSWQEPRWEHHHGWQRDREDEWHGHDHGHRHDHD